MSSFRPAKRWARRRHRQGAGLPPRATPAPSAAARPDHPVAAASGVAPAPKPARPSVKDSFVRPEEGAGRLRRNVGLVLRNRQGKVLAGLRAHASGDKAWQLPQGGIEGRERPATAAYRELREETGIDPRAVRLVRELDHWIDYLLPAEMAAGRKFVGQTQKWFMFDYLEVGLPDVSKATDHEFEQLAWVEMDWLIAHVIEFRKPVYKAVKKAFNLK